MSLKLSPLGLAVLLLSACTAMKTPPSALNLSSSYMQSGGDELVPASDKLSDNCTGDAAFDMCLFQKNPVAQENKAIAVGELASVQRFGVKLRGLTATGYLTNGKLEILTLNTPRLSVAGRPQLKLAPSDENSQIEQLSAYYWANRTLEYLNGRVGAALVPLTPLKIYVDDGFTGYAANRNSIHLEKTTGQVPRALSGDVIVHFMGEALAYDLSGRTLFPGAAAQHKSCGLSPRGCCTNASGCAQALGSAFGDYVTAIMFPTTPRLGEAVSGSTAGQTLCTMSRDLASLAVRTKAEIYAACSSAQGYTTLMGSWYASLWWKLRQQAEVEEAGGAADIDRLFFEHARKWTATSTFVDAKHAALNASAAFMDGKYTVLISGALWGI
ncbi:MAG: hypothetical protein KF799_11760 [Bdellovibrionales bacterium]|nr:hypothetical protein [Bdellovibrionales bacterium]